MVNDVNVRRGGEVIILLLYTAKIRDKISHQDIRALGYAVLFACVLRGSDFV